MVHWILHRISVKVIMSMINRLTSYNSLMMGHLTSQPFQNVNMPIIKSTSIVILVTTPSKETAEGEEREAEKGEAGKVTVLKVTNFNFKFKEEIYGE